MSRWNWAKNVSYGASGRVSPATREELCALVRSSPAIKVAGTGHSFSRIADTTALHLGLEQMPREVRLDRRAAQVTVSGGLAYGTICEFLYQNGFALPNLASLSHISVAGACATATHGSGVHNGNLATAVAALELVDSSGELIRLRRGEEDFAVGAVGLGAAGVITELTLDLLPSFRMRQWVHERLSMDRLEQYFAALMSCAYSVSLFTRWQEDCFSQVWIKERIDDPGASAIGLNSARENLLAQGAVRASAALHPVGEDPQACTAQLGEPGPWHRRLPHFRMEFTPSSGRELQSEYFVAMEDGPAALRSLQGMAKELAPLVLVSEIRTVAADSLVMSPHYRRPSVAIHFTWRQELPPGEMMTARGVTPEIAEVLPKVEGALAPFAPRPHLGKLFAMSAERLKDVYPNLAFFRERIGSRFDPDGKFRNAFLDEFVFGGK